MNRVNFYQRNADGTVTKAVVRVTQSFPIKRPGGPRYLPYLKEAIAMMSRQGWHRTERAAIDLTHTSLARSIRQAFRR